MSRSQLGHRGPCSALSATRCDNLKTVIDSSCDNNRKDGIKNAKLLKRVHSEPEAETSQARPLSVTCVLLTRHRETCEHTSGERGFQCLHIAPGVQIKVRKADDCGGPTP